MAIGAGLLVLIGYFVPGFDSLRAALVQWAVIAGAGAVLVGIGNLFAVHFQKVRRREKDSFYSTLLLVAMLGTLFVGILAYILGFSQAWLRFTVDAIIQPAEASLMALLAITLVYASIRLLRRRADWMSIIFLGTALIVLAGFISLPMLGGVPFLSDWIAPWITYGLAPGGARGLLLGVALGALTTGLRVILAFDRPYGGK
jgi:hypothetical protein